MNLFSNYSISLCFTGIFSALNGFERREGAKKRNVPFSVSVYTLLNSNYCAIFGWVNWSTFGRCKWFIGNILSGNILDVFFSSFLSTRRSRLHYMQLINSEDTRRGQRREQMLSIDLAEHHRTSERLEFESKPSGCQSSFSVFLEFAETFSFSPVFLCVLFCSFCAHSK